jgi:hypothetical protein
MKKGCRNAFSELRGVFYLAVATKKSRLEGWSAQYKSVTSTVGVNNLCRRTQTDFYPRFIDFYG